MDQRTNEQWLADLRAGGVEQLLALDDLRVVIMQSLPYALDGWFAQDNPTFNARADSVVQKTLLHVQEQLDTFDGNSAFSTWVLKFAVRQALLELRLQRWQASATKRAKRDVSLGLQELAADNETLQRIQTIFKDELTQNQRMAIRSMLMFGMPKEQVAQYLGMERYDYFKMIHDARLRLKKRMGLDGLLPLEKETR